MRTNRTIIVGLATVAVVGIAGCSNSGTSANAEATTPESVATSIGCTNVTSDSTHEIYVKSVSTCQLGGKQVRLYSFANETDRDNWMKVATSFTGSGTTFPQGLVVVSAPDTATADVIRAKLG